MWSIGLGAGVKKYRAQVGICSMYADRSFSPGKKDQEKEELISGQAKGGLKWEKWDGACWRGRHNSKTPGRCMVFSLHVYLYGEMMLG